MNEGFDSYLLPGDLCREALEASCDGLLFIDFTGAIKGFDPKFERLIGTPVNAENVESLFPAGCRPLDQLFAGDASAVRYCDLTPEERPLGLPARVEYIRVRDGLVTKVRLAGEHERAAAERNAWMTAILDATESVIIVLDRDGRFVRFNRAAQNMTSFPKRMFWGARSGKPSFLRRTSRVCAGSSAAWSRAPRLNARRAGGR